ncbi:acyl-CoA carboxylase epsilon subunit [Streptomyces niveus]|uniref:Acyl-CoA carboxylase subunit epsilon n=1 Tax=Streptomyces niveus TaxID=193462 RepID=A0ABZ2A795_STRNV|nr:acyl-CoA carboxylase epsilon subunit [Streptomyces niveus]
MIKVVRGNPTPEELAAALAVVRARTAARSEPAPGIAPPPPNWSDPARIARRDTHRAGPRAWARTYWPG